MPSNLISRTLFCSVPVAFPFHSLLHFVFISKLPILDIIPRLLAFVHCSPISPNHKFNISSSIFLFLCALWIRAGLGWALTLLLVLDIRIKFLKMRRWNYLSIEINLHCQQVFETLLSVVIIHICLHALRIAGTTFALGSDWKPRGISTASLSLPWS